MQVATLFEISPRFEWVCLHSALDHGLVSHPACIPTFYLYAPCSSIGPVYLLGSEPSLIGQLISAWFFACLLTLTLIFFSVSFNKACTYSAFKPWPCLTYLRVIARPWCYLAPVILLKNESFFPTLNPFRNVLTHLRNNTSFFAKFHDSPWLHFTLKWLTETKEAGFF